MDPARVILIGLALATGGRAPVPADESLPMVGLHFCLLEPDDVPRMKALIIDAFGADARPGVQASEAPLMKRQCVRLIGQPTTRAAQFHMGNPD